MWEKGTKEAFKGQAWAGCRERREEWEEARRAEREGWSAEACQSSGESGGGVRGVEE